MRKQTAPLNEGKRWRKKRPPIFPIFGIVIGLALLIGPIAADLYETWKNSQAITTMTSVFNEKDSAQTRVLREQAYLYNRYLAGIATSDEVVEMLPYEQQLKVETQEAICWLEIPKTSMKLPVYRGTDEATLSAGVGHLKGTSLPVGGSSTHCVLTGHSGMYNNRMFDDIRQLEVGDVFALHTLGEELVYEVTSITVVLPNDVSALTIQPGEDLCTLITCTPYGVNDHRLLVTGKRTDKAIAHNTVAQDVATYASSTRAWPLYVGLAILALGIVIYVALRKRRKRPIDKTQV